MPKPKTNRRKKSNKERWHYSNCILDVREKIDVEFGICKWMSRYLCFFLKLQAHSISWGFMITIKAILLRNVNFSFWRSQSRYPISRGWKSRNIWYSSKWKHLHCHLFSSPLLSCWMGITQRPPNMSVMAVCSWRAQSCKSDVQTCCSGN